jgi:hypothetical protein
MSGEEVRQVYPDVESSVYQGIETLKRTEEVHGLTVDWHYRIEKGKLTRYDLSKYFQDDELNEKN